MLASYSGPLGTAAARDRAADAPRRVVFIINDNNYDNNDNDNYVYIYIYIYMYIYIYTHVCVCVCVSALAVDFFETCSRVVFASSFFDV